MVLEVYIPSNGAYPSNPPLPLLRCPSLSINGCPHLVSLQLALWRNSIQLTHDSIGEVGIIFQLETFVNDWVQEIGRDDSNGGKAIFGRILERMSSENNPGPLPRVKDLPPPGNRKKNLKETTTVTGNQTVSHSFWERRSQVPTSSASCDRAIQMSREKLPAWSVRVTFLDMIRENLVDFLSR
jgi:hypothetical protein